MVKKLRAANFERQSIIQVKAATQMETNSLNDYDEGTESIVNRGDWLGSPANIKGTNKDAKIYVERSATLHNLFFPFIQYA